MKRTTRIAAAVSAALFMAAGNTSAHEDSTATRTVEVLQGGVARWSDMEAKECGILGRRYSAIDGVCYFPIDMKTKTGVHEIAVWNEGGARTLGSVTVKERECTETEITLDNQDYIEISPENETRSGEERARIVKAVAGQEGDPTFALPLGPPAEGVATKDRSDFCELRIYNGGEVKSRHTGLDYPIANGTAVVAGADGTVTLAEEQFYTGNTVVVDHGGGLVTMVFHLDTLTVAEGDKVKRGDKVGTVGSTGRSTGPHLHYGARWQNQRIDVGALIGDPMSLPGVGEPVAAVAEDTEAVETDSAVPSKDDKLGEDGKPSEAAAKAGDKATAATQSANQTGDPEAAAEAEDNEDAVQDEKEEQDKADDSARYQ